MEILRYSAFSTDPEGGNPAGVVLDASGVDAAAMQRVAAEVGYSETAFLTPGAETVHVRYFSPLAEVPFCGHAAIAAAVAHADRHGPGTLHLTTAAGAVDVRTEAGPDGVTTATLVSVPQRTVDLSAADLVELLGAGRLPARDGRGRAPATITVHQGVDMGRPSLLTVTIGAEAGIAVTGTAVPLTPGTDQASTPTVNAAVSPPETVPVIVASWLS